MAYEPGMRRLMTGSTTGKKGDLVFVWSVNDYKIISLSPSLPRDHGREGTDSPREASSSLTSEFRVAKPFNESTTKVAGSFKTCLAAEDIIRVLLGMVWVRYE